MIELNNYYKSYFIDSVNRKIYQVLSNYFYKMGIDRWICSLPVIGGSMTRLYSYFGKHIAFTDFIHISLGLGVGLIIAGDKWFFIGVLAILIGLLGHVWAYLKEGR